MAVYRQHRNKNYTIMANYHFREREMSLRAKGLLSLIFSLPDDWKYTVAGLCTICKESEQIITLTLKELKEFGYLVVTKQMPNETTDGRISYVYDLYERPSDANIEKQPPENHMVEIAKQPPDFQGVENQPLYIYTKEENTNNTFTKVKGAPKQEPLIAKDVQTGKKEKITKSNFTKYIGTIVNNFTDPAIIEMLTQYLRFRITRGLSDLQWEIIIQDLITQKLSNKEIIEKTRGAIAAGYMTLIPPWEKNQRTKKASFDNTASREVPEAVSKMTGIDRKEWEETLAKNTDGTYKKY